MKSKKICQINFLGQEDSLGVVSPVPLPSYVSEFTRSVLRMLSFCDVWVTSEDWSVPSLLVASSNHILRLVPDAVGTRSYELLASYSEMVTSLAAINVERTVFFATSGASTAFIGRFNILNPTNL